MKAMTSKYSKELYKLGRMKKTVLTIIQWVVIALILFEMFFLFLLYGSGHRIPQNTEMSTYRDLIILSVILVGIIIWKRKLKFPR